LQPLLDEAIPITLRKLWMQKIRYSFFILRVLPENRKECIPCRLYGSNALFIKKNVFNYEEMMRIGVLPILAGLQDGSIFLYGPLLNGATTVILKVFHHIQIFPFLGNYRKT
jgi:hypothetical protein